MGGWIGFGQKKEAEWPYVRNEFVERYCGYCQHGPLKTWPAVLIGMAQASNQCNGFASAAPVLIGNQQQAHYVLSKGEQPCQISVTRLNERIFKQLSALSATDQSESKTIVT